MEWLKLGYGGLAVVMVLIAGLASGLTLSFSAQDASRLEILSRSGSPRVQARARIIANLLKNWHRLLISLIVVNALMAEAIPVVLEQLVSDWASIALAFTCILFFGEIIPQAICARHGFFIAGILAWPVQIMIWLLFPVNFPLALLLDLLLGKEQQQVQYNNEELKQFVSLHAADTSNFLEYVIEFTQKNMSDFISSTTSDYQQCYHTAFAREPILDVIGRIRAEMMQEPDPEIDLIMVLNPNNPDDIVGYSSLSFIYSQFNPFQIDKP
jgi:hypothetical protein